MDDVDVRSPTLNEIVAVDATIPDRPVDPRQKKHSGQKCNC